MQSLRNLSGMERRGYKIMKNDLSIKIIIFSVLLVFSKILIGAELRRSCALLKNLDDKYRIVAEIYTRMSFEELAASKIGSVNKLFLQVRLEDLENKVIKESGPIDIGKVINGIIKFNNFEYSKKQISLLLIARSSRLSIILKEDKDKLIVDRHESIPTK